MAGRSARWTSVGVTVAGVVALGVSLALPWHTWHADDERAARVFAWGMQWEDDPCTLTFFGPAFGCGEVAEDHGPAPEGEPLPGEDKIARGGAMLVGAAFASAPGALLVLTGAVASFLVAAHARWHNWLGVAGVVVLGGATLLHHLGHGVFLEGFDDVYDALGAPFKIEARAPAGAVLGYVALGLLAVGPVVGLLAAPRAPQAAAAAPYVFSWGGAGPAAAAPAPWPPAPQTALPRPAAPRPPLRASTAPAPSRAPAFAAAAPSPAATGLAARPAPPPAARAPPAPGQAAPRRLQCPRCKGAVLVPPGQRPACPACGFR